MKKLLFLLLFPVFMFGQAGYIQVPPDSTGKKIATYSRVQGSDTVHNQIFTLYSTSGTEWGTLTSPLNVILSDGTATLGTFANPLTVEVSLISPGTNNIGDVDIAAAAFSKAEDTAHVSGDFGVFINGVRKDTNSQLTSADADYSPIAVDAYGALFARQDHPNRITCAATGIAASLTQLTNCTTAAVGSNSYYIVSMQFQSTTATSGTFSVQSGTGTNCGTGTTAVFPVSATANRFNAPPTTAGMANVNFMVPLKVTAGHAVCIIGVATNTTSLQLEGFIAP